MKSVIISSNSSGGGKTTVALGLMRALMKKGFTIQGYKIGPDYIDTAFHTKITNNVSRNLDLYLMGEEGIKASFARGNGDLGIVEGVMGLYDGIGISSKYSTAHISKILGLPIVLVISPKAQSTTLCAIINGIIDFEDVDIAGIILNNISESYFKMLKACIERNCNTKVFGYIPKDERITIGSRHLGLIQSSEIKDLEEKIDICSELILKYVNVEELIKYFKETPKFKDRFHIKNKKINIGIARDKAFNFYYRENIELLEEIGEVNYFSPLYDKKLPQNLDFIYIGGGYPEVFLEELSQNRGMLKSIRDCLNRGVRCYAECGGLMYLTKSIDNMNIKRKVVGFFDGRSNMTYRLQNFGYAEINVDKENRILNKGLQIRCHEFHKSYVNLNETTIYNVSKTMYDGTNKQWKCGYYKKNTLGAYAHVHFFNNLNFLNELV